MRYVEHSVRPSLASRVECIWIAEDDAAAPHSPERVLPDGCMEWIFHLASPYARLEAGVEARKQPVSFLVGGLTGPLTIVATGPSRTLGVRFRPGGAADLLSTPLARLTDSTATSAELWGVEGKRIEERVGNARDDSDRRGALEHFLQARLSRSRGPRPRLAAAVAAVLRGRGRTPVSEVARHSGWSRRQLEREFRAGVGLAPKVFSRIVRFQNLLRLAGREAGASWADLAARCGYADQAHLVRDFKDLAGATPASAGSKPTELTRHFISPERLERLFSGGGEDVAFLQDDGRRPF